MGLKCRHHSRHSAQEDGRGISAAWSGGTAARFRGGPVLAGACAERLARYKLPKAFLAVGEIRRHPNGKADYAWAQAAAT
ncbi:MAG TPA: hypothetical protein VKJ83_06485, partial [Actinomycetota bacterium]|nr:hypothetical protein [Actinomycetota bacterium]